MTGNTVKVIHTKDNTVHVKHMLANTVLVINI